MLTTIKARSSEQAALCDILAVLRKNGMTLPDFHLPDVVNLPQPPHVAFDARQQAQLADNLEPTLHAEQLTVVAAVLQAVHDAVNFQPTSHVFFVDGPGGSGKIFKFLIHRLRGLGGQVMACA